LIEKAIRSSNGRANDQFFKITGYQDNHGVRVEFIDNGVGIDLRLARNKLFGLYRRFSIESSGRGLRLFLLKPKMEIMGGSVSVESTVGRRYKIHIKL
jgi:signal transduction histidine kinase